MEFVFKTAVRFTHEAFYRHVVENDRKYQEEIKYAHEDAKRVAEEFKWDEKGQQLYLERQIEKVKQNYESIFAEMYFYRLILFTI